jgi:hypothetical protein
LYETTDLVDQPLARVRFYIVIDNANASTSLSQHMDNSQKTQGKTARGPGKRRVLKEYPFVLPKTAFLPEPKQRVGPAILGPWHAV